MKISQKYLDDVLMTPVWVFLSYKGELFQFFLESINPNQMRDGDT